MTSPDIHALGGAYALDAVDDLERVAFDRHLAECETCALEVAEYRETVTRLAEGAWSVPPPRMRERVLARAAATSQLPRTVTARCGVPVARWRRLPQRPPSSACSGSARPRRPTRCRSSGSATSGPRRARPSSRPPASQAVLAAPDAALRAGDLTGGGRVTLVVSDSQDAGVVVLADAPPPGPDRAYQLWLVPAGSVTPVSAGLLEAGRSRRPS